MLSETSQGLKSFGSKRIQFSSYQGLATCLPGPVDKQQVVRPSRLNEIMRQVARDKVFAINLLSRIKAPKLLSEAVPCDLSRICGAWLEAVLATWD